MAKPLAETWWILCKSIGRVQKYWNVATQFLTARSRRMELSQIIIVAPSCWSRDEGEHTFRSMKEKLHGKACNWGSGSGLGALTGASELGVCSLSLLGRQLRSPLAQM